MSDIVSLTIQQLPDTGLESLGFYRYKREEVAPIARSTANLDIAKWSQCTPVTAYEFQDAANAGKPNRACTSYCHTRHLDPAFEANRNGSLATAQCIVLPEVLLLTSATLGPARVETPKVYHKYSVRLFFSFQEPGDKGAEAGRCRTLPPSTAQCS